MFLDKQYEERNGEQIAIFSFMKDHGNVTAEQRVSVDKILRVISTHMSLSQCFTRCLIIS